MTTNKLHKITLIIGLPCSGKTYLIERSFPNSIKIDDIVNVNELPETLESDLVVSDVHFCITDTLNAAQDILKEKYPNAEIELVYFENNPEKCLNNMKHRNDGRKVEKFIRRVSKEYVIPNGVEPLVIWQKQKD